MRQTDAAGARGLAARLRDVGYTVGGVRALLGDHVADALDRDDVVPARRVLAGDTSPLAVAVRLLLLGEAVPSRDLDRLGAAEGLHPLLTEQDGGWASRVEIAPYASDDRDWLVAADWPPARRGVPAESDHVLGVGGASRMLAQCTVRPEVADALDVGTGCGVQAFHLAGHARRVVATDVSRRCLDMASLNATMNDLVVDLRQGSLFEPVAGETYDLVVSNPPFVIGSPDAERHVYRDSGFVGDDVCARLVRGAVGVLRPGGWLQMLASWEIRDADDWAAGPRSWLAGSPLDAWVVQREVQDPVTYVETWLRDSGADAAPDHAARYDAWLAALEAREVRAVGFGLVTLRAGGHDDPVRRLQHATQPLVQPVGPDVAAWFGRQDVLLAHPGAGVLELPLRTAADVVVDVRHRPGIDEPESVVARRETGFAWSGTLDPFGLAVLDAADGSAAVGEVVAALAAREGLDVGETLAGAVPVLRRLLEEGFVVPVAG